MKNFLRDEGLAKAGKWYIWSKTIENIFAVVLMLLVAGAVLGTMAWLLKQITMMGW